MNNVNNAIKMDIHVYGIDGPLEFFFFFDEPNPSRILSHYVADRGYHDVPNKSSL